MPTVNKKSYNRILTLYSSGLSVREIANKLSVSIDAMYYFFRRYKIRRRGSRENNAIRFERKKPTFQIKNKLTKNEEFLKVAGIMLYWCEGSQWPGETIVDFANSNRNMVKLFLSFLRVVCRIDEKKIRVYLYCYSNQNPIKLMKYWSKITVIPLKQFTKPYIRKDYNKNKIGKMEFGLIHIRYNDKKLLNKIRELIQEYPQFY